MVDSTNLPEVDINQIATDLNGKMDRDCLNASDTGNIQMAHNAMPSDKYIDLTLGASGSTYTAPANGYFYLEKIASNADQYLNLLDLKNIITSEEMSNFNGHYLKVWLPCTKGSQIITNYNVGGTTAYFRFIYAEGEV